VEEKVTATTVDRKKQTVRMLKDNNSVLILVVLLFVALIAIDTFRVGFYKVFTYSAQYGIICLGLSLIMITGNIDLSLGYMATFAGVVCVGTFNSILAATGSTALALVLGIVAALLTGGVLGLFNGTIVTKVGVSPLIATIATNYIYQGLVFFFATTKYSPTEKDAIQAIAKVNIFGWKWLTPMVIIFVIIVAGVFFWMYKTKFGNRLHVVGDNPEAAEFAGISVSKTVLVTYIIGGIMAAATGFMLVAFSGGIDYTQGDTLGTFPISCCVIGGIKMSGGKGTAVHVLLGVLIMRTISTIMSSLHFSAALVNLITGLLLVAVLIVDRFTSTKRAE
jgi:ribose/xylose/arabinose/galactoside ABC-type transport system permease subunit